MWVEFLTDATCAFADQSFLSFAITMSASWKSILSLPFYPKRLIWLLNNDKIVHISSVMITAAFELQLRRYIYV
ncbi:hypothetical protein PanWU01x14_229240 [Parasponia andersonii]|uniref:Uncharacterized protein n=1 Tax=Parasponia andersonii TaxID=3476 RepID=A0A2P5BLE6_PARAD|nr:hypothetical protein PanWU01x14_229240 [Parasponia andersonii]